MANKNIENILQKLQNSTDELNGEISPLSSEEAEALEGGARNGTCPQTNDSCGPNSSCGSSPS